MLVADSTSPLVGTFEVVEVFGGLDETGEEQVQVKRLGEFVSLVLLPESRVTELGSQPLLSRICLGSHT